MTQRKIYADLMQMLLASEIDGTLSAHARGRAMLLASTLIKKHGALVEVLESLRDKDIQHLHPGRRTAREALERDENEQDEKGEV